MGAVGVGPGRASFTSKHLWKQGAWPDPWGRAGVSAQDLFSRFGGIFLFVCF